MEDIISHYNLDVTQVVSTVTDNGSNFVKAFKEFGINAVKFDQHKGDNATEEEEAETVENLLQLTAVEEDIDTSGVASSHYEVEHALSKHVHCASHTLSLVATTDAKNALKNHTFTALNHTMMGKCNALWNKCGRPKSAEVIKGTLKCSLSLSCPTRWNSLHDALVLLLKHRQKLHEMMQTLELPVLKNAELEFIEEYVSVLAPIAVAIDHLQGEEHMYYGQFLPTLLTVQKKLRELKFKTLKHCTPLLQAVSQGFQKRFDKYLQLHDCPDVHDAVLAATTHPFFKLRWIDINKEWDQESRITSLKKDFISSASSFHSPLRNTSPTKEASSSEDEYFGFEKSPTGESTVEMQVMTYPNDSEKSIISLKRHPLILKMFRRYNTMLPSSAPVERLFSLAGLTLTPH